MLTGELQQANMEDPKGVHTVDGMMGRTDDDLAFLGLQGT
jgi:hypothetical protein